ncbi:endogenous retrovirus group K member 10 Gag polyprotein-like [Suncus etruscus]|uniref:endogenous retrovirus group K member 10 Gag polyprotein-like n=1 Tax=Suncus etruscus TaxID=109475 RepID=UPI00210F5F14|nr:endogenous retrovirus group K member 10 Gag polyprotein-like [Suncus etruscus]
MFVNNICPWFAISCPKIVSSAWDLVGAELTNHFSTHGSQSEKEIIQQYWDLLKSIIVKSAFDPKSLQIVKDAQEHLEHISRQRSHPSSRSSSFLHIDSLSPPEEPSSLMQKTLYPSLRAAASETPEEKQDSEEETELQDNAAPYHGNATSLPSQPPMYDLPAPIKMPLPEPDNPLLIEIRQLRQQIAQLQATDPSSPHFLFPVHGPDGEDWEEEGELPSLPLGRPCTRVQARQEAAAAAAAATSAAPIPAARAPQHPAQPDNGSLDHSPDQAEPPDIPEVPISRQLWQYKALDRKDLKELFTAVTSYGLHAPYTLSCLESIGGGSAVLPAEWRDIVRTALKNDVYFSWEADFLLRCQGIAAGNDDLYARIAGIQPYHVLKEQCKLPRSLLANTALAALQAWKSLPQAGTSTAPLSQIVQGPDKPYNSFIARLSEAVEHVLGVTATDADSTLVKQLAFENANDTCKSILRNNLKKKSLHDMINLCREADPFVHKIAKALVAFQGQNKGKTCFQCGAPGHFASRCPQRQTPVLQAGNTNPRPSLCPRCRRGRHWVSACCSVIDLEGNPLPPLPQVQGNGPRGQPQAQKHIAFQPATGTSRHNPPQPAFSQQPQFAALSQTSAPEVQPLVPNGMLPPQQPPLSGPPQGVPG